MNFTLTKHAQRVLAERGIPLAWVERTLDAPERREADPSNSVLERRYRRIPERDGRVLRVVVDAAVDPVRVVSVFFDRRMKGRL